MWDKESDLVKYIMHKLPEHVAKTRIESHGTKNGIPDLYISSRDASFWIEFKNMKTKSIHDRSWKVQWRPGQQTFLVNNQEHLHDEGAVIHRCNFTIIGMSDGIIIIRMAHSFMNDTVVNGGPHVYKFSKASLSHYTQYMFMHWLVTHCYYLSCPIRLKLSHPFTVGAMSMTLLAYNTRMLKRLSYYYKKNEPNDEEQYYRDMADNVLESVGILSMKKENANLTNEQWSYFQVEALEGAISLLEGEEDEDEGDN